jgi:hypothetical protein
VLQLCNLDGIFPTVIELVIHAHAAQSGMRGLEAIQGNYSRLAVGLESLTEEGLELLGLVQQGAEPENVQLLMDIFRKFGLEPEVGSYVLIDDRKRVTFFSDGKK